VVARRDVGGFLRTADDLDDSSVVDGHEELKQIAAITAKFGNERENEHVHLNNLMKFDFRVD